MTPIRAAVLLLLLAGPLPARAQVLDNGCDIETSSFAGVKPPTRQQRSGPIVARPQTPCPTVPGQWDNAIGPIGVEVDMSARRRPPIPQPRN